MTEYIEREAFKKSAEERYCKPCKAEGKDYNGCRCRACWVDDMLDEVECFQPSDVAPVRHGRWEKSEDNYYSLNLVKCSVCHEEWCFEERDDVFDLNYHYCPNCGTYMMGENNGKCE